MVVLLRSFVLVCQELGISNIEYDGLLSKEINGITIQEWADYSLYQFIENESLLTEIQKNQLTVYLKKCEDVLKL